MGLPQGLEVVLFGGLETVSWRGMALPFRLVQNGVTTACDLNVAPEVFLPFQANGGGGGNQFDLMLPQSHVAGFQYTFQVAFPQLGNQFNVATTNAIAMVVGPRPGGGSMATSVSQHGITWEFAQPVRTGMFVNGDHWVVGPVDIVRITPESRSGSRVRHGAMINPDPTTKELGYDSSSAGRWYRTGLNVALDVDGSRPLRLMPGQSLVSSDTVAASSARPQLRTAAILTCLAASAPAGAFRPPYCGADKTLSWNESQIQWGALQSLPRVSGAPTFANLEAAFSRVWLDHQAGWIGRDLHPSDNMPEYGREIALTVGQAALLLNTDATIAEKRQLAICFIQLGIDLHGIARAGGAWYPDGGHASGRKAPILIAGALLNDAAMLATGRQGPVFGEDGQTFVVQETSPGVINGGHGGYTSADLGLAEWGFKHRVDRSRDMRVWSNSYRLCCTANGWVAQLLAIRAMGLRPAWNHQVLFDYMDRYMRIETVGSWTRSFDGWAERMWDAYRPNT